MNNFAYSPATGVNDTTQFPDNDPNIRAHLQALLNQARDAINTKSDITGDTFTGDIKVKKTDGYVSSESPSDSSKLAMHFNSGYGFLHIFNAAMSVVNELKLGSDGSVDFAYLSRSLGMPGYVKLPVAGLILQWGSYTVSTSNTAQNITLPIAFPNNILDVFGSSVSLNSFGGAGSVNKSTIFAWANNSGATINWFAIGN